ncbi:MAG: NADPH-dependent reductase [Actinomycetia bacterium]|nr:NADPH-dependent reductase [Actinomycetes bacterium]
MHVLLIDGSPTGGGRTGAALAAVGAAAAKRGARVELVALGDHQIGGIERAVAQLADADAIAFGSPVYRATAAAPLKQLIDVIPRTNGEDWDSPLAGKAVGIVHTGASLHHFLASNVLRDVLAGFFAAHVLPPGLYVPREGFGEGAALLGPYADQAHQLGSALVELAEVLRTNAVLRSLRPQA